MRIHQQNLEFYGSIERYARSHHAGDGKGLTGMRTLISFTTDGDVLETFGGRDWSVFVNLDLASNPQIYHLGGAEAEYLVPVMIKWRGKGGIINLRFDW